MHSLDEPFGVPGAPSSLSGMAGRAETKPASGSSASRTGSIFFPHDSGGSAPSSPTVLRGEPKELPLDRPKRAGPREGANFLSTIKRSIVGSIFRILYCDGILTALAEAG